LKRSNRLLLIFGVVLAAVSFVVVLAFGSFGQNGQQAAPAKVAVVVASQNLPLGQSVTAEMVSTVDRDPADALDTYQHPEDVVGMVVRRPVAQGAALTTEDFQSNVSVPQLAQSLTPGLRAVSVPLSRVDSVGALLQPGDWVDAVLSLEDLDGLNPVVLSNPSGFQVGPDGSITSPYFQMDEFVNNTSIKVVVQNVQVLAALPPDPTTDSSDPNATTAQPDLVVILAVTPQQAEVIRFAQMDGNISLALRSPGDYAAGETATSGITLRKLVEDYGVLPPVPVTP
jgi:pilus assembly protein CpaB